MPAIETGPSLKLKHDDPIIRQGKTRNQALSQAHSEEEYYSLPKSDEKPFSAETWPTAARKENTNNDKKYQ